MPEKPTEYGKNIIFGIYSSDGSSSTSPDQSPENPFRLRRTPSRTTETPSRPRDNPSRPQFLSDYVQQAILRHIARQQSRTRQSYLIPPAPVREPNSNIHQPSSSTVHLPSEASRTSRINQQNPEENSVISSRLPTPPESGTRVTDPVSLPKEFEILKRVYDELESLSTDLQLINDDYIPGRLPVSFRKPSGPKGCKLERDSESTESEQSEKAAEFSESEMESDQNDKDPSGSEQSDMEIEPSESGYPKVPVGPSGAVQNCNIPKILQSTHERNRGLPCMDLTAESIRNAVIELRFHVECFSRFLITECKRLRLNKNNMEHFKHAYDTFKEEEYPKLSELLYFAQTVMDTNEMDDIFRIHDETENLLLKLNYAYLSLKTYQSYSTKVKETKKKMEHLASTVNSIQEWKENDTDTETETI